MGMLKGFPKSNRLNIGNKIANEDANSSADAKTARAALVGFASKGPINTPVLVRDLRSFYNIFGYPSPEGDSYMPYAAEQCLLVLGEIYIYRAADPKLAKTACVPVPGADNLVKTHSTIKQPYKFKTNQFFRWKLNGVLSPKTLVVLATDGEGVTAQQLAEELNDQLTPKDGIQFYVHNGEYIAVRTTLKTKSDLELVSVQDSIYGPWGAAGLVTDMAPAEKVGVERETYEFDNVYDPCIQLVVGGSGNVSVDGVVQNIKLKGLEGRVNNINDVVDYINKVELPLSPGGWRAFAAGNALGFRTKHSGRDASIVVKPSRTATEIFGFESTAAKGKSPKEFFGSSGSDDISLTVYADSPGTEGNSTRVTIVNDSDSDTFTINVYNNGVQVESWGQLTKDTKSRFYVESFINLVSEWIRVVDNPKNILPPKNGTYLLGDERIAGAVKGCDGIPSDVAEQDKLVVGSSIDRSGLYAFVDRSLYELDFIAAPGRSSGDVISALLQVCEKRADCLAIIDPPMELSATETEAWIKSYKSGSGAIFWPWVKVRDSYNRINAWVPPSGSVVAAIARSDVLSPPWSVPTGVGRGIVPGVLDVFNRPTNEEKSRLSSDSCVVNPVLHYKGYDSFAVSIHNLLNGEKIAAKRLLIYVEKKVRQAIDILLAGYDLSKEELEDKIRQVCDRVLGQIKSSRSIYSYTVHTDVEMSDVNEGFRVKARIGINGREADKETVINLIFEQPDIITNTFKFEKGDR